MTRFDAAEAGTRRALFAEAIRAHRERASAFCTFEAEPGTDADADADGDPEPAPWVQFADATVNFDCTDAEVTAAKALVDEFPPFRIDRLESPDGAEGTNVRVTARADAALLARFVDRVFREVYGRDEDYRAWVTAV
jgi:hypothetical protein